MKTKPERLIEFGNFLKTLRKQKNLSGRDIAKAIGISDPFYYQIETGQKTLVNPETYNKLAELFCIDVKELLIRAGYIEGVKTRREVEELKQQWLADGCWDIETTEGFEEYKEELELFNTVSNLKYEIKKLKNQIEQKDKTIELLSSNKKVVDKIMCLELRINYLERDINNHIDTQHT